jgi:hypothetical protein
LTLPLLYKFIFPPGSYQLSWLNRRVNLHTLFAMPGYGNVKQLVCLTLVAFVTATQQVNIHNFYYRQKNVSFQNAFFYFEEFKIDADRKK